MKDKIKLFKQAAAKLVYNEWTSYLAKREKNNLWYSSAMALDNQLRSHGVIPTSKIYYEYKFPDNLKNFEIDKKTLFERVFPAVYENYLESFNSKRTKYSLFLDQKSNAKNDLSAFFGFCICLALSDIKNLKYVFEQTYNKYMEQIYQMAETIRSLNPELQQIKNYKNLDFVNGAIYGFSPREIEFFIQRRQQYHDFSSDYYDAKNKLEEFIQTDIGYILSPTTLYELLTDIEQQQNNQWQITNFLQPTISR